jgi:NhaP-type Na+/H+ or K+/H+ antiporter
MAMTHGLLEHLDWRGVLIGVALVLVVRPLAGWLALTVRAPDPGLRGGLPVRERRVVAFFGVRGVGSLFYLAYAASHADLAEEPWLWSTVSFTIVLSVVVHGIAATPVMSRLDRERDLVSDDRS